MALIVGQELAPDPQLLAGALLTVLLGGSVVKSEAAIIVIVAITDGPDFVSNDSTPTFSFSISEGAAEYSVDGGAWLPATSPIALGPLADGDHTFSVRSALNHSNLQTVEWRIDTAVHVDLTVDAMIDGATGAAVFAVAVNPPGSAFEYNHNGGGWVTGTPTIDVTDPTPGAYTLQVRATADPAEIQSYAWVVATPSGGGGGDTTPPAVTILSPTPGPLGTVGGFSSDWEVARLTPIVVRITDTAPGNLYQCLVIRYAGAPEQTVYRRGAFRGTFVGSSEAPVANGKDLTILPAGGWPTPDAVTTIELELDAVDADGNLAA